MSRVRAGDDARVGQSSRHQRRRTIVELGELDLEARREAVERLLHVLVRRARRYVTARHRRQRVPRERIVRLRLQPRLAHQNCLLRLANHAVGKRQQAACFGKVRPQGQRRAVARHRLGGPVGGAEQNRQVVVRVGVTGVQPDGRPIGILGLLRRLPVPSATPRGCCGRWRDRGEARSPAGRRRWHRRTTRPIGERCRGCCTNRPGPAWPGDSGR